MSISKTIVINCAGRGSRLGLGYTKALLKFSGVPLIIHHLKQLDKYEDVRIVIGYEPKILIETILKYRKNVIFVFNHNYLNTHTLTSLYLGSCFANDYIISLDGDLLVQPSQLKNFLEQNGEVAGYCKSYSDDAVYASLKERNHISYITGFGKRKTPYEWTGLVQLKKSRINKRFGYVYQIIEPILPIRALEINCSEIDTPNDYNRALEWSNKFLK